MAPRKNKLADGGTRLQFLVTLAPTLTCWVWDVARGEGPSGLCRCFSLCSPHRARGVIQRAYRHTWNQTRLIETPDTIPLGPAAHANQVPTSLLV